MRLQHDVVDDALHVPDDPIVEGDRMAVGAQAQRGSAAGVTVGGRGVGVEIAARARIRPGRPVWCGRRRGDLGEDLPAGAVALVHEPAPAKVVDRRVVDGEAVALPDHLAIPVEPERCQIAQLPALVGDVRLVAIEVLHAHEE